MGQVELHVVRCIPEHKNFSAIVQTPKYVPFYLTEFTHALAVGRQPWVRTAVSGI